jgi:hypothetical protein
MATLSSPKWLPIALLAATLSIPPTLAFNAEAAAPQVRTQAPGFYRMMLGEFEVTALLDGTHPFPVQQVLTRQTSQDNGEAQVSLAEANPGEVVIRAGVSNDKYPRLLNAFAREAKMPVPCFRAKKSEGTPGPSRRLPEKPTP